MKTSVRSYVHSKFCIIGAVFNCKGPTSAVKLWMDAWFDCNITRYPQLQHKDVQWYKYKTGVLSHTQITDNDK